MTDKAKEMRWILWKILFWVIFLVTFPHSSLEMHITNLIFSAIVGFIIADVITKYLIAFKEWWKE